MKSRFTEMQIVSPWSMNPDNVQDEKGVVIKDFNYDGESLAHIWKRGSEDAFCFDLRTNVDFKLPRGQMAKVPTGLYIAMPGHMGCIMRERSGLADRGIRLHAGTLDADYRGEYFVIISYNPMVTIFEPNRIIPDTMTFRRGDRIAQAWFANADAALLRWKLLDLPNQLTDTTRGTGGFGSTGA